MTDLVTDPASELPRWDVTTVFPSLDSREFAAAHEQLTATIDRLVALYDEHDVRGGDKTLDDDAVKSVETVIDATNAAREAVRTVYAYVSSFVTTDAKDAEAQAIDSRLKAQFAPLAALGSRFNEWVAAFGADALGERSPLAADHLWPLQKAERSAQHLMTEAQEDLYAELSVTGSQAWSRLWSDVTSQLTTTVTAPDGTAEELPITVVRARASDADRERRRAAYEGELEGYRSVEIPLAAAMNAIKGEANAINRRRSWEDALAPNLFANNVERETLDAMQHAVVESFPDFRRYLRAKAALFGDEQLAWYDLFAPVPGTVTARTWEQATQSVLGNFGSFSPALRGLAERAFAEQWVDAAPRAGKSGGAFCMSLREDESRILLNFDGTLDGVQTLAHELGHAYHNTTLADRTPLQRQTPMALAETASIFCETLVVHSALQTAAEGERLALLETDLSGAAQVVVDIHSRFLFERSVFERRKDATLAPAALCELMTEAQETTYGDGLATDIRHPYMWAVKPHYYGSSFYNWPYTFGLLFGIGLFARYQQDADRFRANYDDLLSSTGLGSAADLAGRFGIDVRSTDFWTSSLDVIRARIDEFCTLSASQRP